MTMTLHSYNAPTGGMDEFCDVVVAGVAEDGKASDLQMGLEGSYMPVGCHNSQPAYLRTGIANDDINRCAGNTRR